MSNKKCLLWKCKCGETFEYRKRRFPRGVIRICEDLCSEIKVGDWQCSKFSAEVPAQLKKLDGAPVAQFSKISQNQK